MLKQIRQNIIHQLWLRFYQQTSQAKKITQHLKLFNIDQLILDHFAIIDLPGPHSGIPTLSHLFTMLGFSIRGRGYLADKQNDFLWLAESDSERSPAKEVLPQIVVADFRLNEMPSEIKAIIEKYAAHARPFPHEQLERLLHAPSMDHLAINELTEIILFYLQGRDWPLPTKREYHTVREFNELLSWVLVFGRRPNHFTFSVHLLEHFSSFLSFIDFIEQNVQLSLNREGGLIKGNKQIRIEQGSTMGERIHLHLADGEIDIASEFIEFVWRYPRDQQITHPVLWDDYFTDFIPQHADRVIESLA